MGKGLGFAQPQAMQRQAPARRRQRPRPYTDEEIDARTAADEEADPHMHDDGPDMEPDHDPDDGTYDRNAPIGGEAMPDDGGEGYDVRARDPERRHDNYKRRANSERDRGWKPGDYGYENRGPLSEIDNDIHDLPGPTGPDDEMDYWDRSKKATDASFDEWRKKLKKRGYSDDEIEDIISDAVSLHD